ncbi:MAG: peptidyl-prolyl cis-trans isomerase [Oceanihabitans sp.]
MKHQVYILSLLAMLLVSCSFFKKEENKKAIARVGDTYLYQEDISDILEVAVTKEDSIVITNNYINKWANQQLLLQGALVNLSEEKQEHFQNLVEQYKNDLYTNSYLEALVHKNLDTIVTKSEAEKYYNANIEAFKLNEELIKFRYIYLSNKMQDKHAIEIAKKFRRFDSIDKKQLDSMSIQFKTYSLNDSIWIKYNQVVAKIPVINADNKDQLLKKSNFVQLKDSLGLYLMQINDVLLQNNIAPLEYVMPTIEQIVINKRKLEKIKELEKDITKDAITNKQFEIYK